jgi:uncharacterized membrane protein
MGPDATSEGVPAVSRSTGGRLLAVDAMRGTVMLLVFLSHFADGYLYRLGADAEHLRERLNLLTRMASPGFMLISGLMLGLLYARAPERFGTLKLQLQRRGLFLLTVGHVLIVPTCRFWADEPWYLLRVLPVTDTIGLALLVGPSLVTRLGGQARAMLGLGLFAVSWLLSLEWWPHSLAAETFKEVLFGQQHLTVLVSGFPTIPWLGFYLVGSLFGEWLGTWGRTDGVRVARRFQWVGVGMGATGVLLSAVHFWLRRLGGEQWVGGAAEALSELTAHAQKYPPGPTYLALYGGAVLSGLGLMMRAEQRGWLLPYMRWAGVIGRHSLFAFLVQFYVYFLGIYSLRLPYTPLWPLVFLATVAPQWGVLWAWDVREARARVPPPVPAGSV